MMHKSIPCFVTIMLVSIHRDLKLDNTLLDGHKPPWVKLCDFGFAKHWLQTSNMNTMRIGTPEYMGPELISSRCVKTAKVQWTDYHTRGWTEG